MHDVLHGADAGGDGDEQADEAHGLQQPPPELPSPDLEPGHVHADGEVDGERPEPERSDEPQHGVEEWQQHRHQRREHDDDGSQHQLERRHGHCRRRRRRRARRRAEARRHAHVVGGVDELCVGPPARDAGLEPGEDWLREHLVGADEVHDDADVGDVDEPEGLVEGEPSQDVPRRVVPEGGVPSAAEREVEDGGHAEAVEGGLLHRRVLRRRRPERVLDLDEHVGERVGEGDVAQREEHVEGLVAGHVDGGARQRAADVVAAVVGGPFGGAETQADEGVAEGGGDGDDGEPGDVVEAGELREQELEDAEDHHVGAP